MNNQYSFYKDSNSYANRQVRETIQTYRSLDNNEADNNRKKNQVSITDGEKTVEVHLGEDSFTERLTENGRVTITHLEVGMGDARPTGFEVQKFPGSIQGEYLDSYDSTRLDHREASVGEALALFESYSKQFDS